MMRRFLIGWEIGSPCSLFFLSLGESSTFFFGLLFFFLWWLLLLLLLLLLSPPRDSTHLEWHSEGVTTPPPPPPPPQRLRLGLDLAPPKDLEFFGENIRWPFDRSIKDPLIEFKSRLNGTKIGPISRSNSRTIFSRNFLVESNENESSNESFT